MLLRSGILRDQEPIIGRVSYICILREQELNLEQHPPFRVLGFPFVCTSLLFSLLPAPFVVRSSNFFYQFQHFLAVPIL